MNIIHHLLGHVYSLVPIAVADQKLARQIIAWQSWFRRNRYFAFCLCIKGDGALYLHICDTQRWHVILYMWLDYRPVDRELSGNFLVDPSRRQVGHPWNRLYLPTKHTQMPFSTTNKAAYQQYKSSSLLPRTQCYTVSGQSQVHYRSNGKMTTAGLYLWWQNTHYFSVFPIDSAQHAMLFFWIGSQNDSFFWLEVAIGLLAVTRLE